MKTKNQIAAPKAGVGVDQPIMALSMHIRKMSMSEEAKQDAWAEHYERLLNNEFDWDPDHLSKRTAVRRPTYPNHY